MKIPGSQVKKYLEEISDNVDWEHHGIEDEDWEFKDILLSNIKKPPSHPDDDELAQQYSKLKTSFPPIVVVGRPPYDILDGHHRVTAALLRGDETIKAYISI